MTGAQLAPRAARRARGSGMAFSPVVLIVAVGLLGALLAWRLLFGPSPGSAVDMSAIEQQWGIRLTQIGVTADGGLVDIRYQVVDADKALSFLDRPANMPVLIAEDTNVTVRATAMMPMRHDVQAGRTYFILYRNTGGAIHRGGMVTVAFGTMRLEHLVAL
jgi:hypothetical protein